MRRITTLMFAVFTAVVSQGCCSKGASLGWSYKIGRPPTVDTSTILAQGVTNYSAQGLASGPVAGSVGLYAADAAPLALRTVERAPVSCVERQIERAPLPRREMTTAGDCNTLQDVCDKIDRGFSSLAAAMDRQTRAFGQKPPMQLPKED